MKIEDFYAALHTAVPSSTPQAVDKWIDYAVECIEIEEYANFMSSQNRETDIERWLDTLCGGIYAVRAKYGEEVAGKLVCLSLDNCCVFPCEMMQAAKCLQEGGDAVDVFEQVASSVPEPPRFPVPVHPLTERDCGPDIPIEAFKVSCGIWEHLKESGYILLDGTVLVENARDNSGCYKAFDADGAALHPPKLYRPVYTSIGELWAFREVRPAPENYLGIVEMEAEPVSMNVETPQNAVMSETQPGTSIAVGMASKPSLREALRQCRQETADHTQGSVAPGRSRPGQER